MEYFTVYREVTFPERVYTLWRASERTPITGSVKDDCVENGLSEPRPHKGGLV